MQQSTDSKKRPLDTVDLTENDKKKFKTELNQLSSSLDNIQKEKDGEKWNILPRIVHELLALFKSKEKCEKKQPEEIPDNGIDDLENNCCEVKHEDQQDKIVSENKIQDCDIINDKEIENSALEDSLKNNLKKVEGTIEPNKTIAIESSIKNSALEDSLKNNLKKVENTIESPIENSALEDSSKNNLKKAEITIESNTSIAIESPVENSVLEDPLKNILKEVENIIEPNKTIAIESSIEDSALEDPLKNILKEVENIIEPNKTIAIESSIENSVLEDPLKNILKEVENIIEPNKTIAIESSIEDSALEDPLKNILKEVENIIEPNKTIAIESSIENSVLEDPLKNILKEVENIIEPNKTIAIESSIEDSALEDLLKNNLKKVENTIESSIESSAIQSNENVQKKIALNTKTIPTTDIKNNDVIKAEQIPEEVNEKFKRDLVLNFVSTLCLTEIENMPTTKPPACICKYCTYVDSLPLENSVVQNHLNQFASHGWQNNRLHSEMYSSNFTVSDCSTCASKGIYTTNDCSCVNKLEQINTVTAKDVWTNDLINLIKKNENISKTIPKKQPKSFCTNYVKKVYKVVERKFTTRRDKPYFYNYSDVNGHYNRNYKHNRRY